MDVAIIVRILLLAVGVMSHIDKSTTSTTGLIGCRDSRFYNVTHTKYYYEVPANSSVRLPSCGARTNSFSSYWFVYTDFCSKQESSSFAVVDINGVAHCMDRSLLTSFDSCHLNYMFTNESMTIINMTDSIPNEYICFYGRNISNLIYTSAVSYLIRILDSSDEYSTSFSHSPSSEIIVSMPTSETTLTSSAGTSNTTVTATTIDTPSKSWILAIVLPSVIGVILVIAISVIGFVWYRRRRQHEQESAIQLKILT